MSLQLVAFGISGFTHKVRSYMVVPGDPRASQGLSMQLCRLWAPGPGLDCWTHLASQSFSFRCWIRHDESPCHKWKGTWSAVST